MKESEIKFIKLFEENYVYYDGISFNDFITLNEIRFGSAHSIEKKAALLAVTGLLTLAGITGFHNIDRGDIEKNDASTEVVSQRASEVEPIKFSDVESDVVSYKTVPPKTIKKDNVKKKQYKDMSLEELKEEDERLIKLQEKLTKERSKYFKIDHHKYSKQINQIEAKKLHIEGLQKQVRKYIKQIQEGTENTNILNNYTQSDKSTNFDVDKLRKQARRYIEETFKDFFAELKKQGKPEEKLRNKLENILIKKVQNKKYKTRYDFDSDEAYIAYCKTELNKQIKKNFEIESQKLKERFVQQQQIDSAFDSE